MLNSQALTWSLNFLVVASWKEPETGWIENMNGPTGFMIGGAKGIIRTMLCHTNTLIDLVPCDLAVNAIIALAWRVGVENPSKPIFVNITESGENPLTWKEALAAGRKHAFDYPFSGISIRTYLHYRASVTYNTISYLPTDSASA